MYNVHLVGVRFRIRVSTGDRVRVSLGGSFRVRFWLRPSTQLDPIFFGFQFF